MHGISQNNASGPAKASRSASEMPKKFDFLVYEMLLIGALKPNLNVESDSIRAKVFS